MIIFLSVNILIIISLQKNCDCQMSILPKQNVLQGEKVNISCQFNSYISHLPWSLDTKLLAENTKSYDILPIDIFQTGNRYDLIIRNVTLSYEGLWACGPNAVQFNGTLNISVPWSLKSSQVKKLPFISPKKLSDTNATCSSIETGDRRWPYDLLNNASVLVLCESECGLPGPKSISIKYTNSTNTGELSGGTQKRVNCLENTKLYKITHTVNINCQHHKLVGRNEIRCQSQDYHGNLISNKPFYILCPAFPGMDFLTLGEKIAITISVLLAIVDILVIAFLVRKNCGNISDKTDKLHCQEIML